MSKLIRRWRVACLLPAFAIALAGLAGCGGNNERAVIPDKFEPKPDRPPSIGGVPNPGVPVKKGKGPPADS